jgi:RNA polymerase sigma factor (sigma-70 family)
LYIANVCAIKLDRAMVNINVNGTGIVRAVYIRLMAAIEKTGMGQQVNEGAEDELIYRARQGDPAAWETLVRAHQEHIFRLAYLRLQDAAEAEDMAQEAFLRAYLALDRFETGRPFRPWLTRIAVNLARNRRRSLGRYLNHLRRAFASQPQPDHHGAGLDDKFQARWQSETLANAVHRLSRQKQEVLYLRFFLAMTEAEMAEALAIPPGTVKSRLHRAISDLRRVVEADFPELQELFEKG